MKYLLFGTGDYYERYKKWFVSEDVLALLDNSPKKQNTIIDGIRVLSPEEGINLPFDVIVILSFYVKAMKKQLVTLGVQSEKIFHFYDIHSLLQPDRRDGTIKYFGEAETIIYSKNNRKVLLLSQELTLGGPPIALFHAAEVLKKHQYDVVFASMIDGPLKDKLLLNGISVVIDSNLQVATMKEIEWINDFSMIICNTLNFHIFLMERNKDVPIIWWLHDASFFYDGVRMENLKKIPRENLKVVSVGPVPKEAIIHFMPDILVGELLYGVSNQFCEKRAIEHYVKIRIVLIGFLEEIKGQDILLKAFEALPYKIRRNVEILLVGYNETLYAQELREQYKHLREVRFTGSVNREKIHEILQHTDILVCPSRQDSMPTVAAEAMMHGVPCIVSDVTGTAAYIRDGVDGFVFHSEDVQELAAKIEWCIKHDDSLQQIGVGARKIYEKHFSMDVFEQNLLRIVNDV